MSVLSDKDLQSIPDIITPFHKDVIREVDGRKVISYGCSSYGYDIRCTDEFKVFTNIYNTALDPKSFDHRAFVDIKQDFCVIPANSFALTVSREVFKIPRDVVGICFGKSTYARVGVIVNVTPLEPEWQGQLTIEISNTTPLPVKIYANEGIAQIVFIRADNECLTSYADRAGKYMNQQGIVLPKC